MQYSQCLRARSLTRFFSFRESRFLVMWVGFEPQLVDQVVEREVAQRGEFDQPFQPFGVGLLDLIGDLAQFLKLILLDGVRLALLYQFVQSFARLGRQSPIDL